MRLVQIDEGGRSIIFLVNRCPGHSSVTGTSRNDFFPGCFLAPGFLSGKNRRTPIGSYRFQKGPAGDRLENDRNCPKTSDRNPAAKNQSKTARKRSEAAKTGGIRHGNRRNRPAFRGSGNWIDRPGWSRSLRTNIGRSICRPFSCCAVLWLCR